MGVKILGLTNNLNFSLNRKRMEMMKKKKSPRTYRAKLLIALPLVAILIFAFAKPQVVIVDNSQENTRVQNQVDKNKKILVDGWVRDDNGKLLPGANVMIKNTTNGIVTDEGGRYKIEAPEGSQLVISYIGYKTTIVEVKNTVPFLSPTKLERGVFNIELPDISKGKVKMQAPPPPAPKVSESDKDKVFMIVEEMPYYQNGGMTRLALDIHEETILVTEKTRDRGEVVVGFTISANGSIIDPHVVESAGSNVLNESAIEIITKLNNWNPGIQRGKKVPVDLTVPIMFE